jgi:hypothetical protein
LKRPAAEAAAVAGAAAPVCAQPPAVRTTKESSARAMDSREERPAQSVARLHSARQAQSVVPPASSAGQMEAFAASVPATDSRAEPAPVGRQAVAAVALLQVAERVSGLVLERAVAAMDLRQALVLWPRTPPAKQRLRDGSRNQPPQASSRAWVGGALQRA